MNNKKPKVKKETQFSYSDKLSKKKKSFTPKKDEIVATFHPQSTASDTMKTLKETSFSINETLNMQRGFGVFEVSSAKNLKAATESLEARPEIANAIPVMVDEEKNIRYFLPDEFTVQFKDGLSKKDAEKIITSQKAGIVKEQRTPGYYTLSVPEGKGLFATIQVFSSMKEVAFAEPSETGFNDALSYIPNDPQFPKLWGLHNTGQVIEGVTGSIDADVDAPAAWDYTRGKPEVILSVIDTGIDLNHPDLASNILPRGGEDWDFADGGDGLPDDTAGHGTHVAGTAAAVDNITGVIGLAHKCRIMPLRVNLTAGMNQNRADAINYVAAQAVSHTSRRYVINCSWKMSGDHAGVKNAIINAVAKNVVVVFAAGNTYGGSVTYPALYPQTIAVGNTNNKDVIDSSSALGAAIDVSAPGTNIYSTYPDDTYTYLTGTSMASPHVTALAGLIWSRNKNLTNAQVRSIIENTCDNINAKNPTILGKFGKGRINAHRALLSTPAPKLKLDIVRRFRFPQVNDGSSSALAYSRNFPILFLRRPVLLFLTQKPFSERIYYLNPSSGTLLGSIDPINNDTIGSLEWDGNNIRVANVTNGAGFINSINPFTGSQTASIAVPPGRGEGMAYDGVSLYYSTINNIHKLNAATGAVQSSFPPPGGNCRSLAYGEGLLFSGNSATGIITIFDPLTRIVQATIDAPGAGISQAEGMAYDSVNKELFIANQSENTIYVGKVNW